MEAEPLKLVKSSLWREIQNIFVEDQPRGLIVNQLLETQLDWIERNLDYGFKVYCPQGDATKGIVAINKKMSAYEIIIQCPNENTEALKYALCKTKVVNWTHPITVPFAPSNIIKCIEEITTTVKIKPQLILPSQSFVKPKNSKPFGDIRIPDEIQFSFLRPEHASLVDVHWRHRYPTSLWYIQYLIKVQAGFALYKDDVLFSWIFINESGVLGHLYTLEDHRRKGYAELLVKIVSNGMLQKGRDVIAHTVKGNVASGDMFVKLGFEDFVEVSWCYLEPEK